MCNALKTMAAVFGDSAKSKSDSEGMQSATDLFRAAKNGDSEAIDSWVRNHAVGESVFRFRHRGGRKGRGGSHREVLLPLTMKILFLHGWQSTPGGFKPTYLKDHGHTVLNPALPDDDFDAAVRHRPGRVRPAAARYRFKHS